ncbi:MAG: ABC transporter permease [Bacteroidetes bacterium]|nr:ABC transporter permease [Bacteroidota bacterium]
MFKNYLKAAFRSIIKQRVYSGINVVGLSVGIASALIISLFVQYEFSYDKFYPDASSIFKVALERKYPGHSSFYAVVPHSYSDAILQNIPEVKEVTRLTGAVNNILVTYKDPKGEQKAFEENFVLSADSNFFSFFQIPFARGEASKVLVTPNDVVITQRVAKRFFGQEDPVGKTLEIFGNNFKVTGVCLDPPDNSHMKYDFVTNLAGIPFYKRENYTGFSAHLYLKLRDPQSAEAVESKIPKLVDMYAAAQIERELGKSWADYRKEGNGYRYFLQPLTSIHLDPTNIEAKMEPGGSIRVMYFLISVAILLVLIACINFMNLATARSSERAREVGVRKTMGSSKHQLVLQFLSESVIISAIATLLALVIVQLTIPFFNQLTERNLELSFPLSTILALAGSTLLIGMLAGVYPAFVLSGFNPILVMKGKFSASSKGAWLRSTLVIFQFAVSIILIVSTIVVQKQMNFMQKKSLGFDKEQMLVVERVFSLSPDRTHTLLEEVRKLPQVRAAACSNSLPGNEGDFFGNFFKPEGSSEILTTKTMVVADDLPETLGLELSAGKWFAEGTQDSLNIVLNESAVKTMGIANPVGMRLENVQRNQDGSRSVYYTIIGVVKDFNFLSLKDAITPLVIESNETFGRNVPATFLLARIQPGQYEAAISAISAKWKEIAPEQPFRYVFLDENFDANYKSEQQVSRLFAIFSGLAIFVACVGLFGLSAYTAQLRIKEIGIRKVLGASVQGVVGLLAKDFAKMVLIAFIAAIPVSWYLMKQWLGGFAYRIELSPWIFLAAGVLTVMVAAFTVSFQTIRAATTNPVNSLKE